MGAARHQPIGYLGKKSKVVTSGRRAIEHILEHDSGAPVNQWEGGVGASDELRVARRDLKPPDLSDKENQLRLIRTVQGMINETIDVYLSEEERTPAAPAPYTLSSSVGGGSAAMTHRSVNRMFAALGIRCRWLPSGHIEIVDGTRMITGLQERQLAL
jgi:hypothetical protein